jgi:nucleotide-binding universal stress UspA family protein
MKLLLALDDSPFAPVVLDTVASHFRPEATDVRVLHVLEWPAPLPLSLAFAEGASAAADVVAFHDAARHHAGELVAHASSSLRAAGFAVTDEVREGDARQAILDCATEWQPDVILMGSHGRRGLGRFLLGSVSEGIVRHAPCSVYVVRPGQPGTVERQR